MEKTDLKLIIEHDANFFATGDEYMHNSLNLKFIPCELTEGVSQEGIILANANQDLSQGYSLAKNVFEHVKRDTIKFVLIGLSPYILPQNDAEPLVAWDVQTNAPVLEEYIKLCLDNGAKPVVVVLPVNPVLRKTYNADLVKLFRDAINPVVKKHVSSVFIDLLDVKPNVKCFQDNTHLNSEGAAAVSALLGSQLYFKNIISAETFCGMDNDYFKVLEKFFPDDYKRLMHHTFCRMACDDFNRLSKTMTKDTCLELMANVFSEMTYNHLANLSDMLSKDDYNDLADLIFKISAEKIRRKDKIKVGFFAHDSSMWFGDDLYNLFANDGRFEPTLFLFTKNHNKVMNEEFSLDTKRFKSHGVNVFDLNDKSLIIPEQDIFFNLTPYTNSPPVPFRLINLRLTTLLANFSYSLSIADRGGLLNSPFYRVLYKKFASSLIELELLKKICKVFNPSRYIYSGYAKMDFFFKKDANCHFDWKMTRPDAKKIIWAPHHSIVNKGPLLATFHWNYKFIYEFAKTHPETSWIFKSHSHLPEKVIQSKLFPSIDAYKEYLQKWDDLPNAQVYTGAYYQDIFATSDGMIQDSGSFIAEYQYVDKPMIYLTRDTQKFNELGNVILKASYTVDGKDLDAIAAMMQRVFIEGDDYKAAERKKVFDKYLNYPKYNGMLASEFIYKSIVDDLKEVKK